MKTLQQTAKKIAKLAQKNFYGIILKIGAIYMLACLVDRIGVLLGGSDFWLS